MNWSAETGAEVAITVRGLVKHFGQVRALDGVSLSLPAGSRVAETLPDGSSREPPSSR